jgi:hypothetical protein
MTNKTFGQLIKKEDDFVITNDDIRAGQEMRHKLCKTTILNDNPQSPIAAICLQITYHPDKDSSPQITVLALKRPKKNWFDGDECLKEKQLEAVRHFSALCWQAHGQLKA